MRLGNTLASASLNSGKNRRYSLILCDSKAASPMNNL